MRTLALPPAVIVGHSMGCRVVVEGALQATDRVAGVVLVDGSQFVPAMEATLKETFSTPGGFTTLTHRWFQEMFTPKSDPAVVASIIERAGHLPRAIGEKVLLDMVRYDTGRLARSLGSLRLPVMAIQTTYSNERRERRSMSVGQITPYLEMLRARIPSVRIEIIADTGHFPQIDEPAQTNALIDSFITTLPTRSSDQP
jgi:pimeloyl-ACP methyl ester carboxylesterase